MSLADLLGQARRRSITQLILDVCMMAAAIGLVILAVILILGSALIGWQWLALAIVAALGIGGYKLRQKFPTLYEIAQWIDRRLGLEDTLSTAEYFLPGGHIPTNEEADTDQSVCVSQRARAEKIAAGIDLKSAVPFHKPRALYPALTLFAVVAGLFLWRYEALGSFDPRAPLVNPNVSNFFQGPQEALSKKATDKGDKPSEQADEKGERKEGDFAGDPTPQFETPPPDQQGQEQSKQEQAAADEKNKAGDSKQGSDTKQGGEDAEKKEQADNDQGKDGDSSGKSDEEGGSVMDKMRQAVNDLINKMKPQNAKNEKSGKPEKGNQDKQAGEGDKQEGGGDQAESDQSAEGEQGQKSASNKAQEPQQGIGSQEGDKAIKDAEAKKAMGKISELLAKRADNIKGAVMIEVGQTKQQLSTPMAQQASNHAAAGGEIHRDEVPAAYQQFVQKYFEQVRKSPPPTPKKQ